jgi:hypothetical protein
MNYEEAENWQLVNSKMKHEGLHYCFIHYSSFEEIEDEEFHKLRKLYIDVSKKLEEYINKKHTESIWEVDYDDEEDDYDR